MYILGSNSIKVGKEWQSGAKYLSKDDFLWPVKRRIYGRRAVYRPT